MLYHGVLCVSPLSAALCHTKPCCTGGSFQALLGSRLLFQAASQWGAMGKVGSLGPHLKPWSHHKVSLGTQAPCGAGDGGA